MKAITTLPRPRNAAPPCHFKQADVRRAVAAAQAVGIVDVRLEVTAYGRIVIVAAPPGGIPAEIGKFDETAE